MTVKFTDGPLSGTQINIRHGKKVGQWPALLSVGAFMDESGKLKPRFRYKVYRDGSSEFVERFDI